MFSSMALSSTPKFTLASSHHLSCRLASSMYANQASIVGFAPILYQQSHELYALEYYQHLQNRRYHHYHLSLQRDIMFAQDILFKDLEIFSLFHRHSSSTIHQNQPYLRKLNPLMIVDRKRKNAQM